MESSASSGGLRADLVSPWIAAKSGGQCLTFYYTMYGKTMGSLAIKLELSNGKNWFIFYKNGDQGMEWKKGTGNIDVSQGLSYRVRNRNCNSVRFWFFAYILYTLYLYHYTGYIFSS